MKKQYVNPTIQVIFCDTQDILTTSGDNSVFHLPEGYGDIVEW